MLLSGKIGKISLFCAQNMKILEKLSKMIKKKSVAKIFTLTIIGLLLLTACQAEATSVVSSELEIQIQPTASPVLANPTMEAFVFATSDDGFITLHGLLVVRDPLTILPGPDDAIYLVPMDSEDEGVTGIPQFIEGEVPQAEVDERTGEFVFVNIEPGKYAVVVLTKGGSQIPTRSMDDGTYSIFTFTIEQQDQNVELGSLSLP